MTVPDGRDGGQQGRRRRENLPAIRNRDGRLVTPCSSEQTAEHRLRHPCGTRGRFVVFNCDCGAGGWVEICVSCKTVVVSHSPRTRTPCDCIQAMVA